MGRYAKGTRVSTDRSKAEVERTIARYGGDDIVTGRSSRKAEAFVQFRYANLPLEIRIRLPNPLDDRFWRTPAGRRRRNKVQAATLWEKECRQQWRVLVLLIKANLEAVENGLLKAQEVFLPWLMGPRGKSLARELEEHVERWLETGDMPKMLPFPVELNQAAKGSSL